MSKRKRRGILLVVVVVLLAGVVATVAYYPRTFAQAMGNYDLQRLDHIEIWLSHPERGQSREINLSADDPATEELLTLLEGQRYRPVYHAPWSPLHGRAMGLDYLVQGLFYFQKEDDDYPAVFLGCIGHPEITLGPGGLFRRGFRLDPAVQQQMLDLLLEQPYTPVNEA